MPRLWLPTHKYSRPYPNPQNEREDLLNRLYATRTMIPGSKTMDIHELRDRVEQQECKEREGYYDKHAKKKAAVSAAKREQAIGAMREFADWRRKRKQAAGLIKKYD